MNMMKRTFSAGLFTLLSLAALDAWAGRKAINVQGKITDPNGNPLQGSYAVIFRIYRNINDPIGNEAWRGSLQVGVQDGLFNIPLQDGDPGFNLDNLVFNVPYYLGIKVAGDSNELRPRQPLGASAYALGSLGDFHVAQNIVVNSNLSAGGNISTNRNVTAGGDISANGNASIGGNLSVRGRDVSSSLIPPGMIAMFDQSCPGSWTRFTGLDGRVPVGGDSYGEDMEVLLHTATRSTLTTTASTLIWAHTNTQHLR